MDSDATMQDMKCTSWCSTLLASSLLLAATSARAQTAPATTGSAPPDGVSPPTAMSVPPPTTPSAKAPPYSLPWQLRPVVAGNVIRSDTAFAFYKPPAGESANTVASMLLASVKVTSKVAPLVRLGVVRAELPNGQNATNLINPVLGVTYAPKLGSNYRLGLFLGVAFPVGGGGGKTPSNHALANAAGIAARSAMDNAMFAVNYFTVFPGVGFAYTASGFTVQAEVTLLQLTHARGSDSEDRSRTNLTMGAHLGYFLVPALSIGAELRHQRWISTPSPVKSNAAARDTSTVAVGPRFHFQVSEGLWLRPGVALVLPLDAPMSQSDYKVVQLDIPVAF